MHLHFTQEIGLNMCCVFQPAFRCYAHPKAGGKFYFSRFQPFCSIQTFFSDFMSEINKNRLKMNKKSFFVIFCLLLKAGRLPEGVP